MSGMAYEVTIEAPYAEALPRVIAALEAEGFGVLTRIDVHDAFKEKLGVEFRNYSILGACNPPLAHKALSNRPDAGLMLPCNVIVREDADGQVIVGFMDPEAVMRLVDNPKVGEVGSQVRAKMQRVCDAVGSASNVPRERSA